MLAATRLIALHKNKGMTVAACLKNRTDYIENPDKTEQGQYVSSYACSALTADEEFMLTKRQYDLVNGRRQKSDVIAYQIRQSFRPGEITAEEANKVGYELAMRFTKGKHAFVVATHTDRQHIHNHVIFNSTALDGTKKFRDFFFSALAVQRLSDLICLEHQLSVIEKKPYRERQKRVLYPPKESNRDRLCGIIDTIIAEKPKDFEVFLQKLEQQGYKAKRGKHTAVKGKGQKRFIRFQTLGTGYSEEEIKAVLEGKAKHQPYQRTLPKEQPFQLLVDIQGKMAEGKSVGYKKWATKFNLKEMSKTLLFLQEQKIGSAEELRERAAAATDRYHAMGDSIKAAEARLTEIAVLKTHIINYAKTRPVYDAYRKSGYSKKFLEAHREEITLHKAAKAAFDEAGLQKLPKVKELDAEFAELLTKKKASYPDYRKARNEMQELVRAQKNVERFLQRKRTPPRKPRLDKRIPPRSFPTWEASSAAFLVYIAAVLFYKPIFTQPLGFVLCAAGAVEKPATERAVGVVYLRDSIGISKINAAFLTGQQIDRIHVQQLLLPSFMCQGAQRLLLYHVPSQKTIAFLTKDTHKNFSSQKYPDGVE